MHYLSDYTDDAGESLYQLSNFSVVSRIQESVFHAFNIQKEAPYSVSKYISQLNKLNDTRQAQVVLCNSTDYIFIWILSKHTGQLYSVFADKQGLHRICRACSNLGDHLRLS